jgi:hypothetical protein
MPVQIVKRTFRFATMQQQAVFDDFKSPAVLACGAWGSGKTEVALQKALAVACLDPGAVILGAGWLRPTAQRLFKLFVEGEGCNPPICPPDWIDGEPNKSDLTVRVRVPGGWTVPIQFSGLKPGESDITRIQGTQFSFVVCEEATQVREAGLLEELETRSSRVPGAKIYQFLLLCNANAPGHWLHQRFYEGKGAKPGDRLIELPTLPEAAGILPANFYRRFESLTGMLALRYRDNKWVGFEGLVYPYDPRRQLLRRTNDRYVDGDGATICSVADLQSWPCVQGADIGYDHPTVYQWWRVSPDDRWFLQREVYMSGRAMSVHGRQILDVSRQLSVSADCYHDPSAALAVQEWQAMGIQCRPAVNDRIAGQRAVLELYPHALDAAGEVMSPCRLFYCDDALVELDQARKHSGKPTCTTDEEGTYVWLTGAKEDMCKKDDDGEDAKRYTRMGYLTGQPVTSILTMADIMPGMGRVEAGDY